MARTLRQLVKACQVVKNTGPIPRSARIIRKIHSTHASARKRYAYSFMVYNDQLAENLLSEGVSDLARIGVVEIGVML